MSTKRRNGNDERGGHDHRSAAADRADDDASTFRAAMRGVRPLPQNPSAVAPTAVSTRAKPPARRQSAVRSASESLDAQMPLLHDFAAPGDRLSYRRSGVRDRQLRQLRRGAIPVEAEVDLHGLNQAHARELLAEFLEESRNGHRQCVRIIHGKGTRSGARGAVLKAAVDDWLRRHQDVLAFTSARPIDGGGGAVYVLLRG